MTEHVRPEHSLALMALPESDPERRSAESHAANCPACRVLLSEGELMLGWIDDSLKVAPVEAALRNKIKRGFSEPQARAESPVARFLLWAGVALSFLFALLDGHPGELEPALGLKCMLLENLYAVAPFGVAAGLALRGIIEPRPLNLAVVSMAGAVVGQAVLHFRCESVATLHLLAFHVTGVALAAWLGYAASARLLRSRA